MREIILKKRYPHSREEDITDAFMRGYEKGKTDRPNVDRDQIDSAPSIDICFCKECKHRKPSGYVGSIKTYKCDITGFRMHDLTNHFCSYGERIDT